MLRKIYLLLVLFCLQQTVSAQTIRKLKTGELLKMIDTTTVPLVVNFWATWCTPCIHEIPWFEKTVAAFSEKKIRLVLVSIDFPDEYPKGIAAFATKNKYVSQIMWLNESNAEIYCPRIDPSWDGSIPVTLMVNNQKHYRRFYKQQLPEARLQLELEKLIE